MSNFLHGQPVSPSLRRALAAAGLALAMAFAPAASAQKAFPTPEGAAAALVDAVARSDDAALRNVLGADYARVLPPRYQDDESVLRMLAAWARHHAIVRRDDRTAFVEIGSTRWQLPIPIVGSAAGWSFDTRGTAEELRTRRIGRNELAAIKVALAFADAQEEYYAMDPDGDGVKTFATRILSSKGKRDGLYWPALDDERPSPIGPLKAFAGPDRPYFGYMYRVLPAQGAAAPGGAKDYVRNGRMTEGFALVAWPARYGDTGVMTFIVNRDGVVHEKDLGPRTEAIARDMKAYDPDPGWKKSDLPGD